MSHNPFSNREVENATPEQMREELDKYITHVQGHDPKALEFALMIAGHGEENGSTHTCAMIGGPPHILVQVIVDLMDELIKRHPLSAMFFLNKLLRNIRGQQADNTGGADVEAQVKNMIDDLKRSIH